MFNDKKVTAVIMAAGKGSRMQTSLPKQFLMLHGRTVLERAITPFQLSSHVDDILVVINRDFEDTYSKICGSFSKIRELIGGGDERQDSVNNALSRIDEGYVLIHDGARPYVTEKIINNVLHDVMLCGAAVPCVPVKETIREKTKEDSKTESRTTDRNRLFSVQTPQAFEVGIIKEAFEAAYKDGFYGTDDAGLLDRIGKKVAVSEGSYSNIKITTKEDMPVEMRVGQGYDVHRLEHGRRLILCGVEIPFEKGLLGHSDADVAIHALMDAMLGALCLGDIGKLFPDSDMKYKDISSMKLLAHVKTLIEKDGWTLGNADITIMAERPKMLPYIKQMRQNIADVLGTELGLINVKATTTEKLGFVGREEGIAAQAVCILNR